MTQKNPDLHYNRATVIINNLLYFKLLIIKIYNYLQDYQLAIQDYIIAG